MPNLLEQALAFPNLCRSWQAVELNKGVGGVDQVSLRVWQRNWEERLVNLAQNVRSNTYQPQKLRLRRIPKSDPREFRVLRIPTITDRVLQRAVLEVLYPVFEARFLDCSFGYRPRRGLAQAVERILVLRENGFRFVLDADINAFFDSLDCKLLLGFLQRDLPDASLLPLLRAWLRVGLLDPQGWRGLPLGSPLSPLLANVFLHRLDDAILRLDWKMVRYADDFVVLADTQDTIELVYFAVEEILDQLHLKYEPAKTRITSFDQGFDFLGVHFEGDCYEYTFLDKEIKGHGTRVDVLFNQYGPDYS